VFGMLNRKKLCAAVSTRTALMGRRSWDGDMGRNPLLKRRPALATGQRRPNGCGMAADVM